jgi:hypothetical protein
MALLYECIDQSGFRWLNSCIQLNEESSNAGLPCGMIADCWQSDGGGKLCVYPPAKQHPGAAAHHPI